MEKALPKCKPIIKIMENASVMQTNSQLETTSINILWISALI